jgi:hypothetical protein
VPALAISSTDCRRRTMRGEPVWYLVPDGVVQYIAKHQLYPLDGSARPALGLPGVGPAHGSTPVPSNESAS